MKKPMCQNRLPLCRSLTNWTGFENDKHYIKNNPPVFKDFRNNLSHLYEDLNPFSIYWDLFLVLYFPSLNQYIFKDLICLFNENNI